MSSSQDLMPKADLVKDTEQLKHTAVGYIKHVDKKNQIRAAKFIRTRKGNLITGCILGFSVTSIYLYSILAVKQEKFLDDFDEPAKISS